MTPQPNTAPTGPVPLDANNQAFNNWLLGLTAYIYAHYGLLVIPHYLQTGTPALNTTNPQQVDVFWLTSPSYSGTMGIGQQFQYIFGSDYASVAVIVLSNLANQDQKPFPPAFVPQPVVPAPVPPPANPVGAEFDGPGGLPNWTSIEPNSLKIGDKATAADGTPVVKQGRFTPFGWQYWFVKA